MIGISTSLLQMQLPKTITKERYHLSTEYISAVTKAGAISCMLPILNVEDAGEVVGQLDGLILSGGNDVSPQFYDVNMTADTVADYVIERDQYELALIREALRQKKPILGVCRGAQLLNVALGGTLIRDVSELTEKSHIQKNAPAEASHTVNISKESTLYYWLGQKEIGVNSYHHQVIQKVGKDLKVTALSEDGLVEAIEFTGDSLAIGVQWHPEIMANREDNMQALFQAFVDSTKEAASEKKEVI